MATFTFKGGVHPYDGKDLSKDKPIAPYLPKGDLIYPLSQHIGAPAAPIVAKGDRVLVGQKIAEAGGFVSSPVYSSVSGTVKAIEPHFVSTGSKVNSIVIENDGLYEEAEGLSIKPFDEMTKQDILAVIKESGVVGMGGAGFPTHVKLSPKEPDKIDYILVNCAECEPYLTSDYRIMIERPDKIIGGLKVVLELFDNAQGLICIEDNKPEAITTMQKACEGESRIKVVVLKTKYPQGAERMLIHAATGRDLNSTMLPADVGCVVDNCDTITSIYDAVILGKPLTSRVVTISGEAIADPRNFEVKMGTNIAELIEAAGGFKSEAKKVISGGPMMGFAMFDLECPTTKTTSAITCLDKDDISEKPTTACINCGRCVTACDEGLVPARLAQFAERFDLDAFQAWHGMECVECGCCTYACPAKKPLAQMIRNLRRMVMANRKK
ncbi:MAG: electron transport complex subunit RsxC [Lachnospiraceae bacterium]|nr:electron transport complex subunit RsxC [Lachnospiraceae bacterium]